jgi:histidine triad (HIT) family protein
MIPFPIQRAVYYAYRKGMARMFGCIFCQIAAGEKTASRVYEDEICVAFDDVHPRAPVHVLVVPRQHLASLNQATGDEALLGRLMRVAAEVARKKGIDGSGYRVVVNTNGEGGQTVFHLHLHVMGGRFMKWPPG